MHPVQKKGKSHLHNHDNLKSRTDAMHALGISRHPKEAKKRRQTEEENEWLYVMYSKGTEKRSESTDRRLTRRRLAHTQTGVILGDYKKLILMG